MVAELPETDLDHLGELGHGAGEVMTDALVHPPDCQVPHLGRLSVAMRIPSPISLPSMSIAAIDHADHQGQSHQSIDAAVGQVTARMLSMHLNAFDTELSAPADEHLLDLAVGRHLIRPISRQDAEHPIDPRLTGATQVCENLELLLERDDAPDPRVIECVAETHIGPTLPS